ncbi:DNA repair exonuclease [Desulfobacter hydrogenophilus]|uniref:DNA repair exonuclease n=1 Tax=Desulfobacter hydrogenophilus TaxID=2291 RepID=A0A328F832_9BACT|nr:DNA repair exonuclease [Desulfobacter hydrogenophilus]NDY74144.1 DNA repair exonuclease [Desulfobacter hydrogenophilus]QBH15328.1 DNA repair exonuclease [Desulfobacter hydrogenophilus]RAM00798.1 DNA repair exonuclease [Desulfobacter hydrogenophilus]
MFKFIHAADIHLDSPLRGLSRYESAPVDAIRNACRRAFQNLVGLAIEEKVAFVLLAGDLYDGDWKDYSTGIFLSRQMGRLNQHDIQVFCVAGNHDAANRMTKALDTPSNMKIFSAGKVETVKLEELSTAIHGRSFKSRHVDENLATGFCEAEKGVFNIGLLHTSLDGREGHASYAPCSLDDLISKGYQYWALGHIHKQEIVCKDPLVVFPGCIQGRHIRESGPKGCVIVTVEDETVKEIEKIPLDVLRWTQIQIDMTDIEERRDILEKIREAVEKEQISAEDRPLAMRIKLIGTTKLSDQLAAFPERFEQQIKALGAEIAGDQLWIERVENKTQGKYDLETALADDNALGKLLKSIISTPNDVEMIDGLADKIAELRQKVPPQAFGPDTIIDLNDEQTIKRITQEAQKMLIGRMLSSGGDNEN